MYNGWTFVIGALSHVIYLPLCIEGYDGSLPALYNIPRNLTDRVSAQNI
jgi:hypothetical protein